MESGGLCKVEEDDAAKKKKNSEMGCGVSIHQ
jgi:hypothetical protein